MRKIRTLISQGEEGLRVIIEVNDKKVSVTLDEAKNLIKELTCTVNAIEDPIDFESISGVISY